VVPELTFHLRVGLSPKLTILFKLFHTGVPLLKGGGHN